MKILIALLFFSVFLYSFGYNYYNFLVPISYLENQSLKIVGLILIHLSLIWICIAQYQMRTSWRIGIDEENDTELITQGIFSISRNPIFLGTILKCIRIIYYYPQCPYFFYNTIYLLYHSNPNTIRRSFFRKKARCCLFKLQNKKQKDWYNMEHKHIYDAQGKQLCCTQTEKIYTNAGAAELVKEHSKNDGHNHNEHSDEDEHDHSGGSESTFKMFLPSVISLVLFAHCYCV